MHNHENTPFNVNSIESVPLLCFYLVHNIFEGGHFNVELVSH